MSNLHEEAAQAACEAKGWIDMRRYLEPTPMFFNFKTNLFDTMRVATWVELAQANNICWRKGWRHFVCLTCGFRGKLPSRDCFSPSHEDCPNCHDSMHPAESEPDNSLECESSCNLKGPIRWHNKSVKCAAVMGTAEIPYVSMVAEGIPVKDANGAEIGTVTGLATDEQGRRIVYMELNSVAADGLFQVAMFVAENMDAEETDDLPV
jgi:hypothetical protein